MLLVKIFNKIKNMYNYIYNRVIFDINNVNYHKDINIKGRLFLTNEGTINLDSNITFNSRFLSNPIGGNTFSSLVVKKNAKLYIGNNTGISNSSIFCCNSIYIGHNVLIGGDCKIYDTDFHSIYYSDRQERPEVGVISAPVKICNGVFIGTGTIVLKGVTIGENSVIGAGSVVTKNIPPNEVWAGNPAKYIKSIINK